MAFGVLPVSRGWLGSGALRAPRFASTLVSGAGVSVGGGFESGRVWCAFLLSLGFSEGSGLLIFCCGIAPTGGLEIGSARVVVLGVLEGGMGMGSLWVVRVGARSCRGGVS